MSIIAPDAVVGGAIENIPVEKRNRGNPAWVKGGGSPNPGGRPKALAEIQRMLDEEHRNVSSMREVFARLKSFAIGESVIVPHLTDDGTRLELKAEVQADPRFMALYLAYVVGPPKPVENELPAQLQEILKDAPPEVMRYLVSALANQRR